MEDLTAWGAGLFEGEGCFSFVQGRPVACMNSTDHDVLVRFQSVFGGRLNGPYDRGGKPIWSWVCSGGPAVTALYERLRPWLCSRRQARGAEVLQMYAALCVERAARPRLPRTCRSAGCLIETEADEVRIGKKRPQCRRCYKAHKQREATRR